MPSARDQNKDPALDASDLARDLEATILESYTQLTLGNVEAYADSIARDREIALMGISAGGVVVGKDPEAARGDRRPYKKLGARFLAKNLEVHLSGDASVGWVYDEVSYRVVYIEREAAIPIRLTSVYVRDVDRWVLVMEHMSYAVCIEDILELARAGKLKTPRAICAGDSCGGRETEHFRELVRELHHAGGDRARLNRLAGDEKSLVLWPDPDQEYLGTLATEAPPLAELFGAQANVELNDAKVFVGRGKKVAWIAANLTVRLDGDEQLAIGLRASYVLEMRRVGTNRFRWKFVQAHVSVPIEETELSRRVFGDVL